MKLQLVVIMSFLHSISWAQLKYVRIEPYKELRKDFAITDLAFAYKDSVQTFQKVGHLTSALYGMGFLTATVDSGNVHSDTLVIYVYKGNVYRKAYIDIHKVSPLALRKTGLKSLFPEIRKFSYKEFYLAQKRVVNYYQTIGFPFAYTHLDSVHTDGTTLKGTLVVAAGPFMVFDSVAILGKTKTKKKFLGYFSRIRAGNPFNQTTIDHASRLLRQLPYVKVTNEPTVAFINGRAYVTFYIDDKKANQIDGVAGFLPNQQTGSQAPKLLVTGEFNMNLKNMAGKGKGLAVQWRRLKPESQQLDMEYFHPNLLGSPLNIVPSFNLLKQDTTFQTITGTLKTTFNLSGNASMGFYVSSKQSRLLSTKQYSGYSKPPFLDYNLATYGIEYEWNNLDDYFYPKSGNLLYIDANVGSKSIRRNKRLPDVLFEQVKASTTQMYLKAEVRHFFRTGKRNTLLAGAKAGRVFNSNALLNNDLFQIGGLKTLRGFNENFFFAEYYSTGTFEFRQFTDESSYLLLFAEQSYMKYRLGNDDTDDFPLGLGAGISLSTAGGVFNFIYSVGQSKVQKLQFNQSKVHFGYITRF